jgi:cobalt-zinc-cadmium efflux system protein
VGVLLEGTPTHIDVAQVKAAMQAVDGVLDVHDLHVWSITSGMEALSAHVVVGERDERRHSGEILGDLHRELHDRFGLDHLTIQIEPRGFREIDCRTLVKA